MPRAAVIYPSKNELRRMTVAQLNAYIAKLRTRLQWTAGPAHKALSKRLEVAQKVLDFQRGNERDANDV
jgi:hypothetical protein